MKVLMLNGSPRPAGCTYTALREVASVLEKEGVGTEIFQIGSGGVRDCIGCGRCTEEGCIFREDPVNDFIAKAKLADGFVFGSPVYYAHPTGHILSFLDRAFYSSSAMKRHPFRGKPGAAIVSARRAGTTASLDVLSKYFAISSMPVISSTYWNMVHGNSPGELRQDREGLQSMRNLGRNMAAFLKLSAGPGTELIPEQERGSVTNFIR